jgi:hypothetical protein
LGFVEHGEAKTGFQTNGNGIGGQYDKYPGDCTFTEGDSGSLISATISWIKQDITPALLTDKEK